MKKSTLIILLLAILAGAAAYYFDWKRGEKDAAKPATDSTKLAFTLQPDEIQSLTISYPADPKSQPVTFERRDGTWQITQPLQTGADASAIDGIIEGLVAARIEQTEPGAPDRLKVYGLDPADVELDFQLKNGAKHSVKLGKKDFTGSSVYAVLDQGKDVALVPESLLVSSDKPLQVLRDHSVLHIDTNDVRSFDLKNAAGEVVAAKEKSDWNLVKPAAGAADSDAINALLAAISTAKLVSIESETAGEPREIRARQSGDYGYGRRQQGKNRHVADWQKGRGRIFCARCLASHDLPRKSGSGQKASRGISGSPGQEDCAPGSRGFYSR
jgi:hypothetical protein